jgi:hypothetical protein
MDTFIEKYYHLNSLILDIQASINTNETSINTSETDSIFIEEKRMLYYESLENFKDWIKNNDETLYKVILLKKLNII